MKQVIFLSYILYCFYIGVLLLFLPWSALWDRNGLAVRFPAVGDVVLAGSTRGAISALGVLLLVMGAVDALRFIRHGRAFGSGRQEDGRES
ncbi:MAG: hypothetical protein ACE5HD_07615 [Acidobacteriota bacterium]